MSRSRTRIATLLVVPLLAVLAACGSQPPAKLEPVSPPVPDDLCKVLPASVVGSLQTSGDTDPDGTPTSACSLSSAPGATPAVRAVVTITHYDDGSQAAGVYASQCRALDSSTATVTQSLPVKGADKACGSQAKGGDVSTISALRGNDVLTAKASSTPAANPNSQVRGTQMLEAVLATDGSTEPNA